MPEQPLPPVDVTITMTDTEWALVTGAAAALVELIDNFPDAEMIPTQVKQSRSVLGKFIEKVHQGVFESYFEDAAKNIHDSHE